MTGRLAGLGYALAVVMTTTGWTPCASAAIVVDSSQLSHRNGGSSEDMSTLAGPVDAPAPQLDRGWLEMAVLNDLLSPGGAGAPTTNSWVTSSGAFAAVLAVVPLPPPPLGVRVVVDHGPFLPDPPIFQMLRVPRRALRRA